MEQIAFKIMAFSIVLNLATGLFAFIGNGVYSTGNLHYDEKLANADKTAIESAIGGAPVENTDNWGDKILDFFSLGLYSKAKSLVENLLYGFLNMLFSAGIINQGLYSILFVFFTFINLAGAYELFTGKSILGG